MLSRRVAFGHAAMQTPETPLTETCKSRSAIRNSARAQAHVILGRHPSTS